jgi:hypothetical protein
LPTWWASRLTIALDLSARTGKTTALSTVTMAGQALTSEADVRNATGAAYFLSGNQLVMRLVGATEANVQ